MNEFNRENFRLELGDDILPPCFHSFISTSRGHSNFLESPEQGDMQLEPPELVRAIDDEKMKQENIRNEKFEYQHKYVHNKYDRNKDIEEYKVKKKRKYPSHLDVLISPIISSQDLQFISDTDKRFQEILPSSSNELSFSSEHSVVPDNGFYNAADEAFNKTRRLSPYINNNNFSPEKERMEGRRTAKCYPGKSYNPSHGCSPGASFITDAYLLNSKPSFLNDQYFTLQSNSPVHEHEQKEFRDREIEWAKAKESAGYIERTSDLLNEDQCFSHNNQHVDSQMQEVGKLERKRLRNRLAASKCRRRKLEREARLEVQVSNLQNRKTELSAVAESLRKQVTNLKQNILEHMSAGCPINLNMITSNNLYM